MPKKKVEVYDKKQLIYPFIENDHVTFSNGMKISEMLDQGISMPTITHNETSFKVGVGDSDVSSSIVDSSVSKMVIKGQTYQNILPEPSTHVLTNNKEMFKVNEGLDPNVEIVDGVSKNAILKGNTLVNLTQPSLRVWTMNLNSDTASLKATTDEFIIDWSKGVPFNAWIQARNDNSPVFGGMIKPNTDYTFIIRILENNPTFEGVAVTGNVANLQMWGLRGYTAEFHSLKAGVTGTIALKYNFNTITTAAQNIENIFGISVAGTASNGTKTIDGGKLRISKDIIVLEGDYTDKYQYIPYFEGMQSVKMPVLQTIGKNLFDGKFSVNSGPYFIYPVDDGTYTVSITDRDTSVNVDKYSLGDINKKGEMGSIRWIFDEGKYFKTSQTFTNRNLAIYPNTEEAFNKIKQRYHIQIEKGETATPYEPYKSNTLTTPEDLELRAIDKIRDKLNLMTGELTQRIGEIVLDGSEDWNKYNVHTQEGYTAFVVTIPSLNNLYHDTDKIFISADFPTGTWNDYRNNLKTEFVWNHDPNKIGIRVKNEIATDVNGIKAFLSANNIKINYKLATPVVKTVDLSSSGNWEKIVLNGSENWSVSPESSNFNAFFRGYNTVPNNIRVDSNNRTQKVICDILTPFTQLQLCNKPNDNYGISLGWNDSDLCVRLKDFPLTNEGLTQWKQYLSQNPITVWYQTATTLDSTKVKQPIFFKDGHIQLSSGTDNSLIPTLDYQAKTSNSYVMDLMKPSTVYTMKAKSVSGTFTLDGTSFVLSTNSAITTPSTLTRKFLVVKGSMQEMMFLEGNVYSKTIPYFKGIKSAFEDESKIEVLSTGKNLFDGVSYINGFVNSVNNYVVAIDNDVTSILIDVEKNTDYILSTKTHFNRSEIGGSLTPISIGSVTNAITCTRIGNTISFNSGNYTHIIIYLNSTKINMIDVQIEQGTVATTYEPYKSNSTKIPLLCETSKVSEPLAISTEFGRWKVETGEPEETNTTRRSKGTITIPENTSEICFYNNGILRAVNFHALDENEEYIEYIHSTDGRIVVKDKYKKFKIHLGTNDSSNLSCRFTTINNKALRSLPNGVCDELIIDREKNKATLVQRVGVGVLDGTQSMTMADSSVDTSLYQPFYCGDVFGNMAVVPCDVLVVRCDKLLANFQTPAYRNLTVNAIYQYTDSSARLAGQITRKDLGVKGVNDWFRANPTTIYYQLETPVVTEVDLEGFPYIYKDGHIFLNSEIAPTMEITYSINQGQQISASNEDIIRHEKELTYLQKLIAQYVQVNYESVLLSLKV